MNLWGAEREAAITSLTLTTGVTKKRAAAILKKVEDAVEKVRRGEASNARMRELASWVRQ